MENLEVKNVIISDREPMQVEAIVADSEPTQAEAEVPDLHTQEMGEDMVHNETVLADVVLDDVTRVLNEKLRTEVPDGQRKFGMLNPAHRVFWRGKDLVGNEYEGSGDNPSQCNVDAGLMGSCTCHLRPNPSYIAPPTSELPPAQDSQSAAFNNAYTAGWADADSAYQDLKTLILAWVADQMLSSSAASSQDTDSISFVQYVRHNG